MKQDCCLLWIRNRVKQYSIYEKVISRSWVNHKQWNKTLENTKPQNTAAAMSKWASNDCPQRTKQQCTSKPPLGHYKTTIAQWGEIFSKVSFYETALTGHFIKFCFKILSDSQKTLCYLMGYVSLSKIWLNFEMKIQYCNPLIYFLISPW